MKEYVMVEVPTGHDYRQMLLWLRPMASYMSVVKRPGLGLSTGLESFLQSIAQFLIK